MEYINKNQEYPWSIGSEGVYFLYMGKINVGLLHAFQA